MPRGQVLTILLVAALLVGGCESGVPRAEPPTMSPTEPSPLAGVDLSNVPAACIDLGMDDCRRLVAEIAEQVPAGIAPTYIQVGPFGCIEGGGCPRSLIARPQGDVTIEAAGGAISYHVTAAAGGGPLTIERQETFLMALEPQSQPPVTPGVRTYALGHCGLWSGIDAGGSWWDPIGLVDGDHPDAINAANGTLAIVDLDRATFTSEGGFTVQLVRRDGSKGFPGCM